jgi:hypothetical protein
LWFHVRRRLPTAISGFGGRVLATLAAGSQGWGLYHDLLRRLFFVQLGRLAAALAIFFLRSAAWLPEPARENIAGSYFISPLSQLGEGLVRVGKERIFSHDGTVESPASGARL